MFFAHHGAHSPGFLKVVEDAKTRIQEMTIDQARHHLQKNPKAVLVDVREDSEWAEGHAKDAQHLGKGVLERDIETKFPDHQAELIMYCGGGFRSALSCDMAQKMGYKKVYSLAGGFKGLQKAGWPMNGEPAGKVNPSHHSNEHTHGHKGGH